VNESAQIETVVNKKLINLTLIEESIGRDLELNGSIFSTYIRYQLSTAWLTAARNQSYSYNFFFIHSFYFFMESSFEISNRYLSMTVGGAHR